jgi:hypothetical protein
MLTFPFINKSNRSFLSKNFFDYIDPDPHFFQGSDPDPGFFKGWIRSEIVWNRNTASFSPPGRHKRESLCIGILGRWSGASPIIILRKK